MIIETLANFATSVISHLSYPGVFLLMMMEAMCIPIPAEVTMPFSGFLVATGQFNLFVLVLVGFLGNFFGSIIGYCIGYFGGRPLIVRYGKYFLVSSSDLEKAEAFFQKRGESAAFFGRMIPVIRIMVPLAAGVSKMKFSKFLIYTAPVLVIIVSLLTWVGITLQSRWSLLTPYFHKFNLAIALVLVLAIVWYMWRHVKKIKNQNAKIKIVE